MIAAAWMEASASVIMAVACRVITTVILKRLFGSDGKESGCPWRRYRRHRINPWVGKIPWKSKWQPTPVFLSGKLHGQRSPVVYSPWGHKESDMTERLTLLSSLWQIIIVYIGSVTFYQNIKYLFKTHKEAEFRQWCAWWKIRICNFILEIYTFNI